MDTSLAWIWTFGTSFYTKNTQKKMTSLSNTGQYEGPQAFGDAVFSLDENNCLGKY